MTEGYIQTDLGELPIDWEIKQIGDLSPFITSGSRGWAKYYSDKGDPFIRITNLKRNKIYLNLEKLRYVELPSNENEGKRTSLQNGDLLISITADIGIIGYVDSSVPKPSYINQHVSLVRIDADAGNSQFIAYFLASEPVQKLFVGATDQGAKAGLNLDAIKALKFAFPSLEEQERIAAALSSVDELLEALDKLIAKKRDMKTAAMQQLLTGKTRLPGFGDGVGMKQTELGEIPADWDIKSVNELTTDHKQGYYTTEKYIDNGTRLVRITDLNNPRIDYKSMPKLPISKSDFEYYKIKEGDFLFARSGAIGRYGIVESNHPDAVFASYIIRFNFDQNQLLNYFFGYLFETTLIWKQLLSITQGSSNININANNIKSLKVPVPQVDEQRKISTFLSAIDDEITSLEAQRAKTQAIKQGMMQELLTGRTRLL